jgi:hypothetical protein
LRSVWLQLPTSFRAAATMVSSTSASRSVRACTIFPCKGSRPQGHSKAAACRPRRKGLARQGVLERALLLLAVLSTVRRHTGMVVHRHKRLAHVRRSHRPPMQQLSPPTSSFQPTSSTPYSALPPIFFTQNRSSKAEASPTRLVCCFGPEDAARTYFAVAGMGSGCQHTHG